MTGCLGRNNKSLFPGKALWIQHSTNKPHEPFKQQPTKKQNTYNIARTKKQQTTNNRYYTYILHIISYLFCSYHIYIPASSKGCCLNPKGWCFSAPLSSIHFFTSLCWLQHFYNIPIQRMDFFLGCQAHVLPDLGLQFQVILAIGARWL